MGKVNFINNHQDLSDTDLEHIADQVKEGFSSGHICSNEGQTKVYWELNVNVWEDK